MPEKIEVGDIVKCKVTALKPFGAFVDLDGTHHGLIHISQITNGFVKDINDYLSIGDEVTAKVMSIDENGKISLSIRAVQPEAKHKSEQRQPRQEKKTQTKQTPQGFNTLEDKLRIWLKQSNERQEQINKRNNNRLT